MANLDRGFRRIVWVLSGIGGAAFAVLAISAHEPFLVLVAVVVFLVPWIVFFLVRWIALGFMAGDGPRATNKSPAQSHDNVAPPPLMAASAPEARESGASPAEPTTPETPTLVSEPSDTSASSSESKTSATDLKNARQSVGFAVAACTLNAVVVFLLGVWGLGGQASFHGNPVHSSSAFVATAIWLFLAWRIRSRSESAAAAAATLAVVSLVTSVARGIIPGILDVLIILGIGSGLAGIAKLHKLEVQTADTESRRARGAVMWGVSAATVVAIWTLFMVVAKLAGC